MIINFTNFQVLIPFFLDLIPEIFLENNAKICHFLIKYGISNSKNATEFDLILFFTF